MSKIAILGAGSFGTALAVALAAQGHDIVLWGRGAARMQQMARGRENTDYLPKVSLAESIHPTAELADIAGSVAVLLALPAQNLRGFLQELKEGLKDGGESLPACPIVLCAKGVERETGLLQSQILAEFYPHTCVAVISGPGFASEIAAGLPAALTLACADKEQGARLQKMFSGARLRFYLSCDIIGVQLGGALKNVFAIAAGLVAGAGLGASAGAALITRGMGEMSRLATAQGARAETLAGLSGFGDLVLSCTSAQSRNFHFGYQLAHSGAFLSGQTFEGVATAAACLDLAKSNAIETPIIAAVAQILREELSVKEALRVLMARPLRTE